MGKSVIITEKGSQAKDVRAAVGTRFGEILSAQGHLIELKEPGEVNPEWAGSWHEHCFQLLRPESGQYPKKPSRTRGAGDKLKKIKEALKTADRVIVATDPDREGHLIGMEILEHCRYKGLAFRAIFNGTDATTIQNAFGDLRPISEFTNHAAAGEARRQSDQIFNLSLTRAATVVFSCFDDGVIGIGRVKTPTLAIVCRRELEIENFQPITYFVVCAQGQQDGGEKFTLKYEPKEKILDQAFAAALSKAVEGFTGPLGVTTERKRRSPPKLFDLPSLQRRTSTRWGWSGKKTLELMQALYDTHKVTTYPRSEVKYLPESQIKDTSTIVTALQGLSVFNGLELREPQIRKGKTGHFCDACVAGESHTAIVPNVNVMAELDKRYAKLNGDEKKLFDLIASTYLAAVMPDYVYDSTSAKINVPLETKTYEFVAVGNVPITQGWRAVLDEADKKDDMEGLPPLKDGMPAVLSDGRSEKKLTKAPPRYNEGGLIQAMEEAWRFVDKDQPGAAGLIERLKDTKGIGTPATRDTTIDGLCKQGFMTRSAKHVVPTERGRALIDRLETLAPVLTQPAMTALWEDRLEQVATGAVGCQAVIDGIASECRSILSDIEAEHGSGRAIRLPSGSGGGSATAGRAGYKKKGSRGKRRK